MDHFDYYTRGRTAQVFTIDEFDRQVNSGYILPGVDGVGYWGTSEGPDRSAYIIGVPRRPSWTHVYWYDTTEELTMPVEKSRPLLYFTATSGDPGCVPASRVVCLISTSGSATNPLHKSTILVESLPPLAVREEFSDLSHSLEVCIRGPGENFQ